MQANVQPLARALMLRCCSGSASAITTSTRGSSAGNAHARCAASTRYWRVLVWVCVHQLRCAIGTSERNAMSGSPPSRICSAIVTKVLAAPDFVPDIAGHHLLEPGERAPRLSATEIQHLGLRRAVAEPRRRARARRQPRRPRQAARSSVVSIGGKRGGALQCGARDGDRAAPPRRARMVFECGGDVLVEPSVAIARCHSRRSGSATTVASAAYVAWSSRASSGLPYGRADQRMAKAHIAFDNFNEPGVHRGFERIARTRDVSCRRPTQRTISSEGSSAVERGRQQRGARHRRQIVETGRERLLQACGEGRRHRRNAVAVRAEFVRCARVRPVQADYPRPR